MHAIAFDLDLARLRASYGEEYHLAYQEIALVLRDCGFSKTQEGLYVTKDAPDTLFRVSDAVDKLARYDWFKESLRSAHAFRASDWVDVGSRILGQGKNGVAKAGGCVSVECASEVGNTVFAELDDVTMSYGPYKEPGEGSFAMFRGHVVLPVRFERENKDGGTDFAEMEAPSCVVRRSSGFSKGELADLERFARNNLAFLHEEAKEMFGVKDCAGIGGCVLEHMESDAAEGEVW